MRSAKQNVVIDSGEAELDFTGINIANILALNQNTVKVQTLEKCLADRVDGRWRMENTVETVEHRRIQSAIFSTTDNIITPIKPLALGSKKCVVRTDRASVTANSERGQLNLRYHCPFEDTSGINSTFHELNLNDENRGKISEELGEFSVPKT